MKTAHAAFLLSAFAVTWLRWVWKPDPGNPETADDPHGGSNSVKIVNP